MVMFCIPGGRSQVQTLIKLPLSSSSEQLQLLEVDGDHYPTPTLVNMLKMIIDFGLYIYR